MNLLAAMKFTRHKTSHKTNVINVRFKYLCTVYVKNFECIKFCRFLNYQNFKILCAINFMLLYFVYDFRHSVEMMLISTSGDFISQFGLKLYIQGLYCKL